MLAVKKLSDIQKACKNQAEGQALLQRRRAPPALELGGHRASRQLRMPLITSISKDAHLPGQRAERWATERHGS